MRCGIFGPLALRSELMNLKQRGTLIHKPSLIIKYLTTKKPNEFKLAFSIRKKIGNAVIRNLIKRRLREIIRLLLIDSQTHSINCIIIAKKEILSYSFEQLGYEINEAFAKIIKHINNKADNKMDNKID